MQKLFRKFSTLDSYEISVFGVVMIAFNFMALSTPTRSAATLTAETFGIKLSLIGAVILLGVFLGATTTSPWVKFTGNLPYWLFSIISIAIAAYHDLPFLEPILYLLPAAYMFIHWLKSYFVYHDGHQINEPIQ